MPTPRPLHDGSTDPADLIDRIDQLTQDAATWTPQAPITDSWCDPVQATMAAIAVTTTYGSTIVDLSLTEPATDIGNALGPASATRIDAMPGLQLWTADGATGPGNKQATLLLRALLRAVADGDYLASDAERDHACRMLAAADIPTVHGPCLLTGRGPDGETVALGENFRSWYTSLLARVDQVVIVGPPPTA